MSSAPEMTFEQVFASVGTARFLSEYWTKKPLYLKGEKGRFERLFSWADLNQILAWHPPPQPQLRLFQASWWICGAILTGRLAISD